MGRLTRFSHIQAGRREDLGGAYYRSKMEANVARFLKFLQAKDQVLKWSHESRTFWFDKVRRGVVSYKPDFEVWLRGGRPLPPRYEVWEVKGYMDDRSRVKLARMAKYFPDVKVVLIGRDEYAAIAKWSRIIPGWEG